MSIRDLITFAVIFGSLPFCFLRPWIGILVFSWIGYMNPHRFAWGAAYDFSFAQIVAIVTLAGFIFTKEKDKFHLERETLLIILLWLLFTINTFLFAIYPDSAEGMWLKTSKVLLMCVLTIPLFCDKKKLRYLYLTIGLSLGLLAVKGAVFTIVTGGSWNVRGPEGSFIGGEGDFGLALNMALPLLFFLAKGEENKRLKLFLQGTFFATMIAIIFTYRRGAFIALGCVILMLLFKSNKKVLAGIGVAAMIFIAAIYVPEKWYTRMGTITTYEQDASAMGRINAWHFAWNLASDRPFTGGGFQTFSPELFEVYAPNPDAYHDAHSIYFEVLGEQGFIGLGLFMTLLASCFLSLRKIKKDLKDVPSGDWLCNYSDMLQVSLVAYMAGGAFLGRAYFDLFYHLVCTLVVLKVLAKRELEQIECVERDFTAEAAKAIDVRR